MTWLTDRQQIGEEICSVCRGDGTKREVLQPVRARRRPKQKSMTLGEFEEKLAEYARDRQISINLSFNHHYDDPDACAGCEWSSEEDKKRAFSTDSVWTLEMFGRELDPSLRLAAPSLAALMQVLTEYELQPRQQRRSA